eukprot:11193308-Lingulodinium_polyedra.AAC.1
MAISCFRKPAISSLNDTLHWQTLDLCLRELHGFQCLTHLLCLAPVPGKHADELLVAGGGGRILHQRGDPAPVDQRPVEDSLACNPSGRQVHNLVLGLHAKVRRAAGGLEVLEVGLAAPGDVLHGLLKAHLVLLQKGAQSWHNLARVEGDPQHLAVAEELQLGQPIGGLSHHVVPAGVAVQPRPLERVGKRRW